MRILFSPVGTADPLTQLGDGPMLHIVRHYRPDKVVLFLSPLMATNQDEDQRYTEAIILLCNHLNAPMPAIELAVSGYSDVHLYDHYIEEFAAILGKLNNDNPSAEVLVNTSSGAPAMQSALVAFDAFGRLGIRALQVATPRNGANTSQDREPLSDYDLELLWELNEDNKPNAVNRCIEVESANFEDLILRENIAALVNNYDYEGALKILPRHSPLNSEAQKRIEKCLCRQKLQDSSDNQELLFWHIENMAVLLKKQRYSEFLMSINPVRDEFIQLFSGKQINHKDGPHNFTLVNKYIHQLDIQNSLKSLLNKEKVADPRNNVAHYIGKPKPNLSYSGVLSGKHGYYGVLEELRALYEKLYERPKWNSYDASNKGIIRLL